MEQVLGRIFSPIGFCYIYPQLDSLLPTAFVQYIVSSFMINQCSSSFSLEFLLID